MDPVTAVQVVRWGLRVGLEAHELRMLVSELDRFATAHAVSRRQTLEWLSAARGAPGGQIFIAGDRETVRIANAKVRTIAQRALVNQSRWPDSQRLNHWLDTDPDSLA